MAVVIPRYTAGSLAVAPGAGPDLSHSSGTAYDCVVATHSVTATEDFKLTDGHN